MVDLPEFCYTAPYLPITVTIPDDKLASISRVEWVCDALHVEDSPRYTPKGGKTYCNILAWDVSAALGLEVPHWYDEATGEEAAIGQGKEMSANKMWQWLTTHGVEKGWLMSMDRKDAERWSKEGHLTFGLYKASFGPGHVVVVLPDGNGCQAGKHCLRRATLEHCFGGVLGSVRYFAHE